MEEKDLKKPNEVEEVEEEDENLDPDDFEDDVDDDEDEEEEEEDGTSENSEDDDEDEDDDSSEANDEEQKKKEEAEKNAKAARRRRREEAKLKAEKERLERERKIREEAATQAELGMIRTNPYTNKPIVDAEDLKIYKYQKELEDEGLDPIEDLPARIALKNREAAKKAKEEAEKAQREETERQEKIDKEIKDLRAKYPKVNTAELAKDPLFNECLKGRAGRWTQVEIYELYLSEKAKADKKAADDKTEKDAEEKADGVSNPPSAKKNGKSTSKSVEDMTDEEFLAYFNKKYNQ